MKRARLYDALRMIVEGAGWYVNDGGIEGSMHELAHAVLIGRGVILKDFMSKIDPMKDGWANRHEVAVTATQLAALRKLGFKQGIDNAARSVASAMLTANTRITRYDTIAGCRRAILAYKPNPKYVRAIVAAVRAAESALAR